jgi:hypothetical protein
MESGEIFGNTVFEGEGGGVYVFSGTFTKTGGIITGYDDDTANGNIVKDSSGDTVVDNLGHAVYKSATLFRDTTLGGLDKISTTDQSSPPWGL